MVWQHSIALVETSHSVTASFPKHEQFGLIGQSCHAAVSAPSNIAEGAARSTRKELLHFLSTARDSHSEIDTLIEIAGRLGYMADHQSPPNQTNQVAGSLHARIAD